MIWRSLNYLGLESLLENLSGGQHTKIILAKLLLENPDALPFDKPTNFLDKELSI